MTKARTVIKAKDEGDQPKDPSVLERKCELAEQIGAEASSISLDELLIPTLFNLTSLTVPKCVVTIYPMQ